MMKFELIEVSGIKGALLGLRLPMCKDLKEVMEKSDSILIGHTVHIDNTDKELCKKLINGDTMSGHGQPNSKFLRMIHAQICVTAPVYFMSELDTYKVGTTRNSTSVMHKGMSRNLNINDFEVEPEIVECLTENVEKTYDFIIPYETEEFRIYKPGNVSYKVYKNGRIVREAYDYKDSWGTGRIRHIPEKELKPTKAGKYFTASISFAQNTHENVAWHRIVASVWLNNANNLPQVDHIDKNTGNNSVENLEWVSQQENIKREFDYTINLRTKYLKWKNGLKIKPETLTAISLDSETSRKVLMSKYNLTDNQYSYIKNPPENFDLFMQAYYWESVIKSLNDLIESYKDTNDIAYFRLFRQLLPMAYNYTSILDVDYQTLRNIYFWRKNHKLSEWHSFCEFLKTLPESWLITEEK